MAGDAKTERLRQWPLGFPVGRIGQPADIARAFGSVIHNGFVTGTVVHADGGHRLV